MCVLCLTKRYLHSGVGNNLVSVFVPSDQGLREGRQGRRAQDCSLALACRRSLFFAREPPHN